MAAAARRLRAYADQRGRNWGRAGAAGAGGGKLAEISGRLEDLLDDAGMRFVCSLVSAQGWGGTGWLEEALGPLRPLCLQLSTSLAESEPADGPPPGSPAGSWPAQPASWAVGMALRAIPSTSTGTAAASATAAALGKRKFFAGGRAACGDAAPPPAGAPRGGLDTPAKRPTSSPAESTASCKTPGVEMQGSAHRRRRRGPHPPCSGGFESLPAPVTELIFAKLPVRARHVCRTVCREWARRVEGLTPELWGRVLDFEGGRRLSSVDVWMNLSPCQYVPPRVSEACTSFRVTELDLSSCELVSFSTLVLLLRGCTPWLRRCEAPRGVKLTAEGVQQVCHALDGCNSAAIRAALPGSHAGRLLLTASLELDLFHDKALVPLLRAACQEGSDPYAEDDECPVELRARSVVVLLENEHHATSDSVGAVEALRIFFGGSKNGRRDPSANATRRLEVGGHVGALGLQERAAAYLGRTASTSGLVEISVNHQGGGDALALALARAIPGSSLATVSLRNNLIGDAGARALISAVLGPESKVTSLDLCLNRVTGEATMGPIEAAAGPIARGVLAAAGGTPGPSLQEVCLGYNRVSDGGARHLAVALLRLCELRKLNLDGNNIKAAGARAVAEALMGSELSSLYLDGNSVGLEGARHLGRALSLPSSSLVELSLSGNALGDQGVHELLLRGSGRLELLGLQENHLNGSCLTDLHRALATGSLKALNLSGNALQGLGPVLQGMQAQSRRAGQALESLYVSDNRLGDAGSLEIADFMRSAEGSRGLRILCLDENPIADAGAIALIQALAETRSVLSFSAMGSQCSHAALREATDFIKARSNRCNSVSLPSLPSMLDSATLAAVQAHAAAQA